MKENTMDILNTCDEIAVSLHSLKITQMVREAREAVTGDRETNLLFTGQSLPLLLRTVQSVLEEEVLPHRAFAYVEKACRFEFFYREGDDREILFNGKALGKEAAELVKGIKEAGEDTIPLIRIGLEKEVLKGQNMTVLYSYNEFAEYNWKKEFDYAYMVFLIINATAALNLNERNFTETIVKGLLGGARFGIITCNLELLTSQEEAEAVRESVTTYKTLSGLDFRMFDEEQEELKAFICTEMAGDMAGLRELAISQSVINCIAEIEEAMKTIEEDAKLDVKEIEELIAELEKRKSKIEISGRIAATAISGSFSAKLRYELTSDINKYNDDALNNIIKAVEASTDIEATKRKIPKYLEDIWNSFETAQEKKLKADTQDLIDKIYVKMEQDVGEFFQDISESKGRVLEYAMRHMAIDGGTIQFEVKESSTEKTVDKVSKAMLWGSIPVALLINLPMGIAAAVGSAVVKKAAQKTIDTENRETIKKEIRVICNETKKEMLSSADSSVDTVVKKVEQEIAEAYHKFVESVLLELNHMRDKAQEAGKLVDYIREIKADTLPALKAGAI